MPVIAMKRRVKQSHIQTAKTHQMPTGVLSLIYLSLSMVCLFRISVKPYRTSKQKQPASRSGGGATSTLWDTPVPAPLGQDRKLRRLFRFDPRARPKLDRQIDALPTAINHGERDDITRACL